ncbi:MAG: serine/threonine-protein kinase, partial [Myxococcota bacterium]
MSPLLAAEVEELVRLERELSKSLTGFHPPSPDSPERVALYRITGVLGRGGMGVVYRAEQSRPVERVVALKVIRQGLESQEARSRFASEQQALALMNHRNVATVYQLGHTEAGRPYLAMEYVSGDDLSSHCDRKRATLKDRVRLFLQVCDGVQHAHQKGVIHRDLKPSNTLVQESLGQPPILKLIDFGVAKSLTRKLNPSAVGTQLGVLIGTLHYSSPEQITGRYAKVDTRSDVYSLGVMLYELLSGVPPRDASDFEGRTQYELAEMFESSEPPPLAGRFLQQHNNREIAEARSTTASDVRNVLSGDLSWIVARCLERDPDARYPSAQDLRSD